LPLPRGKFTTYLPVVIDSTVPMFKKIYTSISGFIRGVITEVGKVSFPSRSETVGSTTVVIVFTLIVSIFLFLVDTILVRLLRLVV